MANNPWQTPVTEQDALLAWALQAAGGGDPRGWLRKGYSTGERDGCDFHTRCFHHVERFWRLPGTRQHRAIAIRVILEGREPSPKERPQYEMFRTRFAAWYREHPIMILKRMEEA